MCTGKKGKARPIKTIKNTRTEGYTYIKTHKQ